MNTLADLQAVLVNKKHYEDVYNNERSNLVFLGKSDIEPGRLLVHCGTEGVEVEVVRVSYLRLFDINDNDNWNADGNILKEISEINPEVKIGDVVTVIDFTPSKYEKVGRNKDGSYYSKSYNDNDNDAYDPSSAFEDDEYDLVDNLPKSVGILRPVK